MPPKRPAESFSLISVSWGLAVSPTARRLFHLRFVSLAIECASVIEGIMSIRTRALSDSVSYMKGSGVALVGIGTDLVIWSISTPVCVVTCFLSVITLGIAVLINALTGFASIKPCQYK